jgi:hypothetical protein
MLLSDMKIFLACDDFHLEISVFGIYCVEFIHDSRYPLIASFGKDYGAYVVLVWEMGLSKVHVSDVAYYCESTGNFVYVLGKSCGKDFIWTIRLVTEGCTRCPEIIV